MWLDGEKIYEYGNEEDAPSFMKSPGSCWHIVNIPEDSAGKSLEVRIIPVYDNYYGNEVSIVYGTRGNCVLKILMDSFKTLLLSDCSMDTGTMWIPAVFDSGWKNFVFCRLFFILPFPGTL